MNSNDKSEKNVIDASSDQAVSTNSVRYPLASDQINTLQNINYKDYLRMSEEQNVDFLTNTEVFASTQDSIKLGMNIVGQILTSLGIPFVKPIISFYTVIIGLLWPSSGKNPWKFFMEQVEELIDQKIEEYARNKALAELEGLGNNFELYRVALEEWKENPNISRTTRDVRTRFEILDGLFTQYMPSFKVSGHEVPLLTVYAQAASLHLLLLKDASIFGEEWGLPTATINNYYKRQMNLTAQYSDHCVNWYNTGLDRLKGSNAKSWLSYHRFRREMTLMVLDLVALYPNYDVRTYPIETTVQLSREVYTDPIGYNPKNPENSGFGLPWASLNSHNFTQIEREVIRPPHAFNILNSVEIGTIKQKLLFNDKEYINYWSGHLLEYTYANDSEIYKKDYGNLNTFEKNKIDLKDKDIYRIDSTAVCLANFYTYIYGSTKSNFHMVNTDNLKPVSYSYSKTHTASPSKIQNYDSENALPQETTDEPSYQSYNHRLAHITTYPFWHTNGSNSQSGFLPVFVWTHRSVDLYNFIDSKKITQIPAVKGLQNYIQKGANIEEGSGYTGGDVVTLHNFESSPKLVHLYATAAENALSQKYRVRVRYVSEGNGELYMRVKKSPDEFFGQTASAKITQTKNSEEKLTSKNFKYTEFDELVSPLVPKFIIEITAVNMLFCPHCKLYVDKIEFIPVAE